MSGIIWGNINLNNEDINLDTCELMMNPMKKYKIDKYNYIEDTEFYIGCGIQYITDECEKEVLPYNDYKSNLIITADAILDNREELLEKLELRNHKVGDFTDSQYILMAYKKWGNECPKYLLGDFTFVIYDRSSKKVFCARDQVGKRILYYYFDKDSLVFSTLMEPIVNVVDNAEINEKWIIENLAIIGVLNSTSDRETIYNNIFKVPPGTSIIISNEYIKFYKYWNPERDIKEVKLMSDKEYEKLFLDTLTEAINCRLRSNKEIGISLSSGLDSTSVAAIAAKSLKEREKFLISFTSVPLEENNDISINGRTINESIGVNLMEEKLGNLKTNFLEFRDESSINNIDKINSIFEQPYKGIENIYWYIGIPLEAARQRCNVLLDGQFGNLTISYGGYYTYLYTLIKKIRLFKLAKEVKIISHKYGMRKKQVIKIICGLAVPYYIKKKRFAYKNKSFNKYKWTPVNEGILNKYKINETLEERNMNIFPDKIRAWKSLKKLIVTPSILSHLGEHETKISLYTGVLKRDPCRDVRVIEMIMSFPIEQFVKDGVERSLIRRAMQGLIPDEILQDKIPRGLQSADWVERLKGNWHITIKEIEVMLDDKLCNYYLDLEKMKAYTNKYKELKGEYSDEEKYELRTLLTAFVFYKYINTHNNIKLSRN